jgi:hypothetical protein
MVIESQAMATKRAQEGYTYQNERGFDVAEKVAQNEGVGNFTNTGIGLGMMGGMAGGIAPMVAGITTDALNPLSQPQGAPVTGIGIIPPAAPPTATPDGMAVFKQKLEKLKTMKDMGMLSDEEFEAERKKMLNSL